MAGRFHMFGVLVIPFIMIGMAFGKKGYKGILPYLTFAGVSTCLTMFLLSNFVGAEVTSMARASSPSFSPLHMSSSPA